MRASGWLPVPRQSLVAWTQQLLAADASYYQLPFWNEPYRQVRGNVHYLVHGPAGAPRAAVCVVVLGAGPLRVGLVHHGPVLLDAGAAVEELAADLLAWARGQGMVFLRFSHPDESFLEALAGGGPGERIDAFPLHRADPKWDLVRDLGESEEHLLASFRQDARRAIRRDQARGYGLRVESSPKALTEVWPLFEAHSRQRDFRHQRPLAWWQEVLRLAEPHGTARLYIASLGDRPVAADLYIHDRRRVRSITAWDETALAGAPSPSAFLLYRGMCDLLRLGVREFSFGASTGSVGEYKRKFKPVKVIHPEPLTLVANPWLYRLWRPLVSALGVRRWSRLRRTLAG